MPVTLLKTNQEWPDVRILVRETFGAGETGDLAISGTNWTALPMQKAGQRKHGFEFLDCDRACLPYVGRARFQLQYGFFSDGLISAEAGTVQRLQSGEPWDITQDNLDIQDLRGYEVRIQFSDDDGTTWTTGWFGQVEYQEDAGAPGSTLPMGTRIYHCVDGLHRISRWYITRHGYENLFGGGISQRVARGPMGYNLPAEHDALLSANRSSSQFTDDGVDIFYHTAPGLGDSTWTAQLAAEHALAICRPPGEPLLTFQGCTTLLQDAHPWPVLETNTAADILNLICRRERGRGTVFLQWTDQSNGAIALWLQVNPQLLDTINFYNPVEEGNDPNPITGADDFGSTVNPDLIGDHRCYTPDLQFGDPYQFRYDYLETLGEQIEVLATLAYVDGISGADGQWNGQAIVHAWSDAEATVFRAFTGANQFYRIRTQYRPVFQLHSLRPDWNLQSGNGNGAALGTSRIDYRCADNGDITTPTTSDDYDTSPASIVVMGDLPLFDNWTSGQLGVDNPAFGTAVTGGSQLLPVSRLPPLGLVRTADNKYLSFHQVGANVSVASDKNHLVISNGGDEDEGTRFFSMLSDSTLYPGFDYKQLAITVGLRLPHRARFASGNANGRRRGVMNHPGFHLWLSSPGAIWGLDGPTSGGNNWDGFLPIRASDMPSLPIRDDRSALCRLHQITWAWYGTDTTRRSCQWGLMCCGLLPSFTAVESLTTNPVASAATTIAYPTLGGLVNQLGANGEYHVINTPITRIYYDHKRGKTIWSTEWSELERERS